jgi:hypothetical protein
VNRDVTRLLTSTTFLKRWRSDDNHCRMSSERDASTQSTRNAVFISFAVIAILLAVAGLMPLTQPRISYNHVRAAHWTRQLIRAEHDYAGSFPLVGFTCDLRRLAEAGLIDEVLASGDKSGYRYELRGCGATGTVAAFGVAALPIKAGTTGKFAFCGNQEGVLWYADDGSADDCFHHRVKWTMADPLHD